MDIMCEGHNVETKKLQLDGALAAGPGLWLRAPKARSDKSHVASGPRHQPNRGATSVADGVRVDDDNRTIKHQLRVGEAAKQRERRGGAEA